jgi:hypothetical protein
VEFLRTKRKHRNDCLYAALLPFGKLTFEKVGKLRNIICVFGGDNLGASASKLLN